MKVPTRVGPGAPVPSSGVFLSHSEEGSGPRESSKEGTPLH